MFRVLECSCCSAENSYSITPYHLSPDHLTSTPTPLLTYSLHTHSHTPYPRAGAISSEQAVSLNVLIDQGDERVKRVFCLYEADKDVYQLIDALKIFKSREEVMMTLLCVCLCVCFIEGLRKARSRGRKGERETLCVAFCCFICEAMLVMHAVHQF